jgi:hypothetical protein
LTADDGEAERFAADKREIDALLERGGYDQRQRASWWATRRGSLSGRTPRDALRFGEAATVRLMAQRIALSAKGFDS